MVAEDLVAEHFLSVRASGPALDLRQNAINGEVNAGHIAAVIRSQEQNGSGGVIRRPGRG